MGTQKRRTRPREEKAVSQQEHRSIQAERKSQVRKKQSKHIGTLERVVFQKQSTFR
jgi:hypothetical protein